MANMYCNFSLIAVVQAIPKAFAKEHMPKETRQVSLSDSNRYKWPTKWVYKDKDGGVTSGLSAGWRGFALDHRLEEGDVCVFELVKGDNLDLLVHIFQPEEDRGEYLPNSHKSVRGSDQEQRKRKTSDTGSDQEQRKRKTSDTVGIHQDPLRIQEPGNGLQDSTQKTHPPLT